MRYWVVATVGGILLVLGGYLRWRNPYFVVIRVSFRGIRRSPWVYRVVALYARKTPTSRKVLERGAWGQGKSDWPEIPRFELLADHRPDARRRTLRSANRPTSRGRRGPNDLATRYIFGSTRRSDRRQQTSPSDWQSCTPEDYK